MDLYFLSKPQNVEGSELLFSPIFFFLFLNETLNFAELEKAPSSCCQ